MARPRNITDTVRISLSTSPQVRQFLEELAATGFYGKTAAEVAERLLSRKILDMAPDRIDVFLSYSSEDSAIASEMAEDFEALDLRCFMAEKDLMAGTVWQEKIREALQYSRVGVILVTPNSISSNWIMCEAGAFWSLNKPLAPAIMHASIHELPEVISTYQCGRYETAADRKKFVDGVKELCRREDAIRKFTAL